MKKLTTIALGIVVAAVLIATYTTYATLKSSRETVVHAFHPAAELVAAVSRRAPATLRLTTTRRLYCPSADSDDCYIVLSVQHWAGSSAELRRELEPLLVGALPQVKAEPRTLNEAYLPRMKRVKVELGDEDAFFINLVEGR